MANQSRNEGAILDSNVGIPKEILRKLLICLFINFLNKTPRRGEKKKKNCGKERKRNKNKNPLKVRAIAAKHVGSLVTVQGIVTRITDVKPLMRVATYICDMCGNEIYQSVNKRHYTPLVECPTQQCQRNRNKRPLLAMTRGSKFDKFQEIKLQESPEEVPEGNVPRSITAYAMGECTRQCTCGDKITISGIWLPIPVEGGFRAMRAGLTTDTYLQVMNLRKEKKGYELTQQDEQLLDQVEAMSEDPLIYSKLSRSIAPEIYGLEDVKKALLLLLVAGVTKQQVRFFIFLKKKGGGKRGKHIFKKKKKLKNVFLFLKKWTKGDGLKIRGDINILLMGDPVFENLRNCSKTQKKKKKKCTCDTTKQAVYTTGKGSSGVGLTAAVMRDNLTKDMVLEGGALVLSDMGICCIDEFDKMEDSDRTAIHEVMEQQTISIAKAGITTTLNARTAILAAANPAFGRYDILRKPEQNINLPAALLSRFDLLFVLVDKPDPSTDEALALHITHVHQHNTHPRLDFEPFSPALIRAYVTKARQFEPIIPKSLTEYIVNCYVAMRRDSLDEHGQYDSRKIVGTPRSLLSILRISQALARLRLSANVNQADVEEAIRLIHEAKKSTLPTEMVVDPIDVTSRIYELIKDHAQQRGKTARIAQIKSMLTTRGFNENDVDKTLKVYQEHDVWQISQDGETLHIVD
ncbi:DNA replication licensing factor [Reticulomyxa filosa]|uniref:DNA replication licensing factor MCM7 n=1 Tax=Reticulomyxa filosa TaxID=46433 RepID=X6MC44_RETFI|nr:DNA replication licensing factor [Reticulomyxa filosa]|eukprot:ETO11414.1 DNA replication licensing factor [Reticulomyxa filosa]